MSEATTKQITINVKDLSFKSDQHVIDLIRFMSEALPQISINRSGNELDIDMPNKLSKRAIRLRIKKFLYKNGLKEEFRPILYKTMDKEGYSVKERRVIELSYY
ncbi:MAG: hypothetical protein ACFE8L_13265 [Candidatus Hodarchaeota archaeon]